MHITLNYNEDCILLNMKNFGDAITELKLSFGKAIITLKKAGLIIGDDYYTVDTPISEEQYAVLLKLSIKRRKRQNKNSKMMNAEQSSTLNNSIRPFETFLLSPKSFLACDKRAINIINHILSKRIEKDIENVQKKRIEILNMPLYETMVISKGTKVARKHYFYTLSFRKKLISTECIGTWLACKLSGAVNENFITKETYLIIYSKYLHEYIKQIKSTPSRKTGSHKTWYSVVSVPFGGMNKR